MKQTIAIQEQTKCSICGKNILNLKMEKGMICAECYGQKLKENQAYQRLLKAILSA